MLLGLLIVVGWVVVSYLRKERRRNPAVKEEVKICSTTGGVCCGGGGEHCHHKQSQKTQYTYYEDEELDRFRGRTPEEYTEGEMAEWQEVYSTLQESEVEGWLRSIEERGLVLPARLQSELQK